MQQHLHYRGPRGRREKERIWENFWRDYGWKFPQHGKGNSQEVQRVPYRINPRRNTPRHILIKLTKTKHKERILKAARESKNKKFFKKAAREKQQVTYKGNLICLTADLSGNSAGQKGMAGYIWSTDREESAMKITVPSKNLIQNWWRNKKLFI